MRLLLINILLGFGLLLGSCSTNTQLRAHSQNCLRFPQQTMDVKLAVVNSMGTPRPDVVVVLSIEDGSTGNWLHRQATTGSSGSAIVSLERSFIEQHAVIAVLDQAGRSLYTTEKLITGPGQRLRIELE